MTKTKYKAYRVTYFTCVGEADGGFCQSLDLFAHSKTHARLLAEGIIRRTMGNYPGPPVPERVVVIGIKKVNY